MIEIKIIEGGPAVITCKEPVEITGPSNRHSYMKGTEEKPSFTFALCRCGKSIIQPLCDGSHKKEKDGPNYEEE